MRSVSGIHHKSGIIYSTVGALITIIFICIMDHVRICRGSNNITRAYYKIGVTLERDRYNTKI